MLDLGKDLGDVRHEDQHTAEGGTNPSAAKAADKAAVSCLEIRSFLAATTNASLRLFLRRFLKTCCDHDAINFFIGDEPFPPTFDEVQMLGLGGCKFASSEC